MIQQKVSTIKVLGFKNLNRNFGFWEENGGVARYKIQYNGQYNTVDNTIQWTIQYSGQYSTVDNTVQWTIQYSGKYNTMDNTIQWTIQYLSLIHI